MELTVREVAAVLGISPRTVRARLERGELVGSSADARGSCDARAFR